MSLPSLLASSAEPKGSIFAGLDGCRGGWFLALWQPTHQVLDLRLLTTMAELGAMSRPPVCVVVDMPLILEDVAVVGGRRCDREARAMLPRGRKSSIFSAPTRAALEAWRTGGGYREVHRVQKATGAQAPGLSLQAFHLLKHIDDLQRFVVANKTLSCLEGHPELAFHRQCSARDVCLVSKHQAFGRQQRQQILTDLGMPWSDAWSARERGDPATLQAGRADALDACILAHVSHQYYLQRAERCPAKTREKDGTGSIYF